MPLKKQHGNSRQGDNPGARSKLGKKTRLRFRRFLISGSLWSLLTPPSHPTRSGPALPDHTLRINPTPCMPWVSQLPAAMVTAAWAQRDFPAQGNAGGAAGNATKEAEL